MCHRDARVGRRRDSRRDSGHDRERYAGALERLGLLAAAPEHERVPALQADDSLARPREVDQQTVDLLLASPRIARAFAGVDQLRIRSSPCDQLGCDQAVVDDRVGAFDELDGARRREARISGPRADQIDDAGGWLLDLPSVAPPAPRRVALLRELTADGTTGELARVDVEVEPRRILTDLLYQRPIRVDTPVATRQEWLESPVETGGTSFAPLKSAWSGRPPADVLPANTSAANATTDMETAANRRMRISPPC
jgi:hypothetical protein